MKPPPVPPSIALVGLSLALATVATLPGCRRQPAPAPAPVPQAADPVEPFTRPLPPGRVALRKVGPEEYPDFSVRPDEVPALVAAIGHSLDYLSRDSSRQHFPYLDISHERAVATLEDLRATLEALPPDHPGPLALDEQIAERYEVYKSVGAPDPAGSGRYTDAVLFTGYFTPIYEASRTRGGPYQWPLYKRPADLSVDPDTGEVLGRDTGMTTGLRTPVLDYPYYTRAQIEGEGKLAGQELVWLASRWEAYVVTIQGSAILRLPDGSRMEVGYAGTNGLEYVSPGLQMVNDGVIRQSDLSLKTMGDYFAEHPEDMDKYLWLNPRTTSFAETAGGPFGSLNVPVTPMATIATDKEVYPRAMPAFIATVSVPGSNTVPFLRRVLGSQRGTPAELLVLDQDTGGAIRAAGRCDIYMGVGDEAGRRAGRQFETGELYYLALKPELVPARDSR